MCAFAALYKPLSKLFSGLLSLLYTDWYSSPKQPPHQSAWWFVYCFIASSSTSVRGVPSSDKHFQSSSKLGWHWCDSQSLMLRRNIIRVALCVRETKMLCVIRHFCCCCFRLLSMCLSRKGKIYVTVDLNDNIFFSQSLTYDLLYSPQQMGH